MISIAMVDDEDSCLSLMKGYLKRAEEDLHEKFEIVSFHDGLDFLEGYRSEYDVVFMDIEMPMQDGMTTARKLRLIDENVSLVFVTNMAQYAIKGYEVDALDFMVKPVRYANFLSKLKKAIKRIVHLPQEDVTISCNGIIKRIPIRDITYLEVIKNYVCYHTINGNFEMRNSLSAAEEPLLKYHFIRCNNCYLVNLHFVSEVSASFAVVSGDELQISRHRKKEFTDALTAYLGGKR